MSSTELKLSILGLLLLGLASPAFTQSPTASKGEIQKPISSILPDIDRFSLDFFEFYEIVESLESRNNVSQDSIALVILKYFMGEDYTKKRDSLTKIMYREQVRQEMLNEQLTEELDSKNSALVEAIKEKKKLEAKAVAQNKSIWKTKIVANSVGVTRLGFTYDLSLMVIAGKKKFLYAGPLLGYKRNLEGELPIILGVQALIPISIKGIGKKVEAPIAYSPNLFLTGAFYTSNFFFNSNESARHTDSVLGRVAREGTWGGRITIGYSPNPKVLLGVSAIYEKFVGNNDPVFIYHTEFSVGLGTQVSFLF